MNTMYASVIKWRSDEDANEEHLTDERNELVIEMILDDKTDGDLYYLGDATYLREFVSPEAAQKYIDFVISLAKKYNKVIISSHIEERN